MMNNAKNLVKELSKESHAKLEAAIEAGATHARFTYCLLYTSDAADE